MSKMAVYKNAYSRHKLMVGDVTRWSVAIIIITSLYLMSSSSVMCTLIIKNEKQSVHHGRHHNHHRDEVDSGNSKGFGVLNSDSDYSKLKASSSKQVDSGSARPNQYEGLDKLGSSTNLESELKNIKKDKPYRNNRKKFSDYEYLSDGQQDFHDYESEDPRPHMREENKFQLEKSLLEHTSSKPNGESDISHRHKLTRHIVQPEEDKQVLHKGRNVQKTYPEIDRLRFRHDDDTLNAASFHPHNLQCPTCYAHYVNHHEKSFGGNPATSKLDSEGIRLEAIKRQILNKLGLKSRPIIKKKLPREVVLQSLYRAEEDNHQFFSDEKIDRKQSKLHLTEDGSHREANGEYQSSMQWEGGGGSGESGATPTPSTNEVQDDFYARTSEIIIFGEAGSTINNQQLVEFSLSAHSGSATGAAGVGSGQTSGGGTMEPELRIRAATLWVRTSFEPGVSATLRHLTSHKNITLWVFRQTQPVVGNKINDEEFNKFMKVEGNIVIPLSSMGWQKLDLTKTVRNWYQSIVSTSSSSSNFEDPKDPASPKYNSTNYGNYESVMFQNYAKKSERQFDDYDYDIYTEEQSEETKKLRLLIDCSNCKGLIHIHLFHKKPTRYTNDKQKQKNRDYEAYKYDGYINDGADKPGQKEDQGTPSTNSKQYDQESKSPNSTKHRYSNHERNGKSQMVQNDSPEDTNDNEDPNRPFLVIHTDPNIMKRVRRRALDCNGAINGQCCKQRFYVNFTTLGWEDWIVAPQGYYANYCMGSCNSGHRTPDTFLNYYTHVIHEYQKYGDLKGLQPCCAPVKFSSTSLIYFGPDSNIIKRDLPKMTVDECGCP